MDYMNIWNKMKKWPLLNKEEVLVAKRIRQNALVKFKPDREEDWHYYPFTDKDTFVYLGDIAQMPGHCIVVKTKSNAIFTCYHTDNFYELTEEEC